MINITKKLSAEKLLELLFIDELKDPELHAQLQASFIKMEHMGVSMVEAKDGFHFVGEDKQTTHAVLVSEKTMKLLKQKQLMVYALKILQDEVIMGFNTVFFGNDQTDPKAEVGVWTDKGTGPVSESPAVAPCDGPTLTDMFVDQAEDVQLEQKMENDGAVKIEKAKEPTPTLKAGVGPFWADPKEAMKMHQVKLVNATVLYQPVNGTDASSTYHCVAISGQFKFAARRKGGNLSVRVEGPVADKKLALVQAGFNADYIEKGYTSVHFHNVDTVMAARALGAILSGTNFSFDTPMPNLSVIDGAGA